jgi:hypothetical protein
VKNAADTHRRATTATVTSVGIVTRDRASGLIACLESYLENCQRHGRAPEFVVTDDSPSAEAQDGTRAALKRLKSDFNAQIRYAGSGAKGRFAKALAGESGVPLEIVRFALFGDDRSALSTGANRNCLLLDTVGTLVLSVDDDTVCRIAAAPEQEDDLAFYSGYDPTEFWFFPEHARAVESVSFVEIDVLARHEALLGRSVADVSGSADASGRVAITLHGLLGDSGMVSPRYYLGLTGASRDRLMASADAYRSAFRSREVLRTVRRPTISTGSFCMTTFLGFDNRSLLPPFFPVQRNSDGVFGLLLQKYMDGSHVAFLPWLLLHAPAAPRAFASDDVWSDGGSVRMADIVIACVLGHPAGHRRFTDATRLRRLGQYLQTLGSLTLPDFEAHVRSLLRYRTYAFVTLLQSHLQTYGASPRFWADDVKQVIDVMLKSMTTEDYVVPRDLCDVHDVERARRLSQQFIAKFGELLAAWPAIVAAAKRLRKKGSRVTDAIGD